MSVETKNKLNIEKLLHQFNKGLLRLTYSIHVVICTWIVEIVEGTKENVRNTVSVSIPLDAQVDKGIQQTGIAQFQGLQRTKRLFSQD